MKPTIKHILNEASSLPPVERAELVERIIESFDSEPDKSVRVAWGAEAERRFAEYKEGGAAIVTAEEIDSL